MRNLHREVCEHFFTHYSLWIFILSKQYVYHIAYCMMSTNNHFMKLKEKIFIQPAMENTFQFYVSLSLF